MQLATFLQRSQHPVLIQQPRLYLSRRGMVGHSGRRERRTAAALLGLPHLDFSRALLDPSPLETSLQVLRAADQQSPLTLNLSVTLEDLLEDYYLHSLGSPLPSPDLLSAEHQQQGLNLTLDELHPSLAEVPQGHRDDLLHRLLISAALASENNFMLLTPASTWALAETYLFCDDAELWMQEQLLNFRSEDDPRPVDEPLDPQEQAEFYEWLGTNAQLMPEHIKAELQANGFWDVRPLDRRTLQQLRQDATSPLAPLADAVLDWQDAAQALNTAYERWPELNFLDTIYSGEYQEFNYHHLAPKCLTPLALIDLPEHDTQRSTLLMVLDDPYQYSMECGHFPMPAALLNLAAPTEAVQAALSALDQAARAATHFLKALSP